MPRVPMWTSQVAPNNPTIRQDVHANADAFGAGDARVMIAAGNGLLQAGQTMTGVAADAKQQEELERKRAEAKAEYEAEKAAARAEREAEKQEILAAKGSSLAAANEYLKQMRDKETAFSTLAGPAANEALPKFREEEDALYQSLNQNLSPAAQEMFQYKVFGHKNAYLDSVTKKAADQLQAYEIEERAALIGNNESTALANLHNDQLFNEAMRDAEINTKVLLDAKGKGAEYTNGETQKVLTAILGKAITQDVEAENFDRAATRLELYKEKMTGAARNDLMEMVNTKRQESAVTKNVTSLLRESNGDATKAWEKINEIADTNDRALYRRELSAQASVYAEQAEAQRKAFNDSYIENILSGGKITGYHQGKKVPAELMIKAEEMRNRATDVSPAAIETENKFLMLSPQEQAKYDLSKTAGVLGANKVRELYEVQRDAIKKLKDGSKATEVETAAQLRNRYAERFKDKPEVQNTFLRETAQRIREDGADSLAKQEVIYQDMVKTYAMKAYEPDWVFDNATTIGDARTKDFEDKLQGGKGAPYYPAERPAGVSPQAVYNASGKCWLYKDSAGKIHSWDEGGHYKGELERK